MGIEIILHQMDFHRLGIAGRQGLAKQRVFTLGSLRIDRHETLAGERFDGGEQRTGAVFFISIMFFTDLAALHRQRLDFVTDQKARAFVKTDHRVLRIVRQAVQTKYLLHVGDKGAVDFADTPAFIQMRL